MSAPLEAWSDFNVAVASASGALAGLLIVAMSVNIEKILAARGGTARSATAIASLAIGLLATCLCLVPNQPLWALGAEILGGTVLLAVYACSAVRYIVTDRTQPWHLMPVKVVLAVAPLALFVIGGVALIVTDSPGGYGWVAAGAVMAMLSGVAFSWIALVEFLR
ncbi:hypothetical protein [Gordonia soli]|uniref:Modulator of FtsH protease n=1 Tax=Gordonia soli NBRC 108243 TaxID=1223545 RepID=M0QCE5_9ACTN|nr:hypothetical protein [Gordonia soli]GAC66235.1 hypothetical protein GS4_01_00360 [Gordonia soli NBRC 108243]